jgi:hypothetical protein
MQDFWQLEVQSFLQFRVASSYNCRQFHTSAIGTMVTLSVFVDNFNA